MTQTPPESAGTPQQRPTIIHTGPGFTPGIGSTSGSVSPGTSNPPDGGAGQAKAPPRITHFGERARHEESWTRTPNTTGTGAIHVRTFHTKLTDEALVYLDQTINEWLDAHPQYEVKFVTTTIGEFTGKVREPHLICQVWV